MNKQKVVELELLREGPPHNRLLSPNTSYLGLCGNYGAATIHVPWEHRSFLLRLSELRYPGLTKDNNVTSAKRQEVINELAEDISRILGASPGLATGLTDRRDAELTHLRMVVSAEELAMLPFELAKNIAGTPGGEENWLSIQTATPICLTRRVRNVNTSLESWPQENIKILFVASSAGGSIPFEQHLQILHKAIKPWLEPYAPDDKESLFKSTEKVMTILLNASIEDVDQACRKQNYTHVHILAHGMEDNKREDKPFGLAMRDKSNPGKIDVVSGRRFSAALHPLKQHKGPTVVTVASCDSAAISSVIYTGASFAHDLHREGVPLVVASQFPLTFSGSITMVELLYGGLLWGDHPIKLLYELRRKLYAYKSNRNHDWASLVVYESLPENIDNTLLLLQYYQTKAACNLIFKRVEKLINDIGKLDDYDHKSKNCQNDDSRKTACCNTIKDLFSCLDHTSKRFPEDAKYQTEILGLHGSSEKRKAEAYFKLSRKLKENNKKNESSSNELEDSLTALQSSIIFYSKAIDMEMTSRKDSRTFGSLHWVATQYLSIAMILRKPFDAGLWYSARTAASTDIRVGNCNEIVWAHGSLAELYLIRYAYSNEEFSDNKDSDKNLAYKNIGHLLELVKDDVFQIKSTKQQLSRYKDWWLHKDFQKFLNKKLNDQPNIINIEATNSLINELLEIFPDNLDIAN